METRGTTQIDFRLESSRQPRRTAVVRMFPMAMILSIAASLVVPAAAFALYYLSQF